MLFDGVCNVCNRSVDFILRHDPQGHFRFASLQSGAAQRALAEAGKPPQEILRTLVLVEDGRVFEQSTAAVRIARRLSGLWPVLSAIAVVPRPIRDAAYRWFIAHRYRWFGKRESCRIPEPEIRDRFLE